MPSAPGPPAAEQKRQGAGCCRRPARRNPATAGPGLTRRRRRPRELSRPPSTCPVGDRSSTRQASGRPEHEAGLQQVVLQELGDAPDSQAQPRRTRSTRASTVHARRMPSTVPSAASRTAGATSSPSAPGAPWTGQRGQGQRATPAPPLPAAAEDRSFPGRPAPLPDAGIPTGPAAVVAVLEEALARSSGVAR